MFARSLLTFSNLGGHGALTIALKNPGVYTSVSAFAPICNPTKCPWGEKAFTGYLGEDKSAWAAYDATELAKSYSGPSIPILCDQGEADDFYPKKQLLPENFIEACGSNSALNLEFRFQPGYDHSYYFIATFAEDHIRFHARALSGQ